jgi:polyhydroxyalkanoate synthesis regulator phasin
MSDAWQSYLEMAMGLTKASRKKAQKAVKDLVGKGNAKAGELQEMAESLLAAGLANREAITKLVDAEVDKALGKVGLVKSDEVTALQRRVAELEQKLAAREEHGPAASALAAPVNATPLATPAADEEPAVDAPVADEKPAAAAPVVAKKVVAKKTVAKKAPAEPKPAAEAKPVAKVAAKAAAAEVQSTVAAAKKAKQVVKKTPAAKDTAKKAPAKKATGAA